MRCQHCRMPRVGSHQYSYDHREGVDVYGRCLDGVTSWLPMVFDDTVPPGGWVCAVDGCGLPVESEPCGKHGGAS